jgi:hypothetical protein
MTGEPIATCDLMDKDKITRDDTIGTFTIDLQEVQNRGSISKWYPLFYKNKPAGEILMEACFQSEGLGSQSYGAGSYGNEYAAGSEYAAGTTGSGLIGAGAAGYGASNIADYGMTNTSANLASASTSNVANEVFTGTTGVLQEKILEEHTSAYQPGSKFYTNKAK